MAESQKVPDITKYAVGPESYDILSAAQIKNFFNKHKSITKDDCDGLAAEILKSSVSPTPMQGGSSYTVTAEHVPKVVQFRTYKLDMKLIGLIRQSYKNFVPNCVAHNMVGTAHLYVWDLVRGPAYCRVRRRILALGREKYLQRTVCDFARFFASAWNNRPAITPPVGLFEEYCDTIDTLSQKLPQRFLPKLDQIRRSLSLLFRSDYPMVIQHDDLLENNIHVDEDTGQITGIVDWQDAIIAPFGISISSLETLLGVQTLTTWHFHHDHVSLREQFWRTFYEEIGEVSDLDRQTIEIARLFGLFRLHGFEVNAAGYLDVLCPP